MNKIQKSEEQGADTKTGGRDGHDHRCSKLGQEEGGEKYGAKYQANAATTQNNASPVGGNVPLFVV